MTPQSVGVPDSRLVLGKHSGRHALGLRCEQLGFQFDRRELDEIYRRFVVLADQIKHVQEHHLLELIEQTHGAAGRIPPGHVEAPAAALAASVAVGENGREYSQKAFAVSLLPDLTVPLHPAGDHHADQEDYLWGV
jgi:hypothetical protein